MIGAGSSQIEDVGRDMVRSAPEGWEVLHVHVRGAGGSARIVAKARMSAAADDVQFALGVAGSTACVELRAEMYAAGKGTWYVADIRLDRSGHLDTEFDYESWPFGSEEMDENLREMLEEDQELFPRPVELLPPWHPMRDES